MHPRLEKPIIREEMAETSAAALIKFAFSIASSKMLKFTLHTVCDFYFVSKKQVLE